MFLGFAAAGAPGLSLVRSGAALMAFVVGAAIGGRIGLPIASGSTDRPTSTAFGLEAGLLFAAAGATVGAGSDLSHVPVRLYAAIVFTGLAMGIRNAVVRKLAAPDLTTTVLTLTLTGVAADSPVAGGNGRRWLRRVASVGLMFAGAVAGAWLVARSVAHALAVAGVISALSAISAHRRLRPVAPNQFAERGPNTSRK